MTRRSTSCFEGTEGWIALLEPILNQILQAEMPEHLRAKPSEQTGDRRGYRNVSAKTDDPSRHD